MTRILKGPPRLSAKHVAGLARAAANIRGPTWSSVFQTVEGGLGYWAGNHFRYGPPNFSMNATPQCYDYLRL